MLFMMNFDEWLSGEMEKRSWSQSDLARHAGLSQAQVSRVANGLRPPGNDFCLAVAKAFKLPVEIVMRKAGLLPPDGEKTEQKDELVYLFDQLKQAGQEDLINYAHFLLEKQDRGA